MKLVPVPLGWKITRAVARTFSGIPFCAGRVVSPFTVAMPRSGKGAWGFEEAIRFSSKYLKIN